MKDINVPGQAQALVAEYQLKGRVRLSLDETIVPVVIVSDVQDANPGQPESPGGTVINPAATVGEFGFGGVRAAPGSILRVDSIIIDDEGGGGGTHHVKLVNAAEIAAVTVTTTNITSLGRPNHPSVPGLQSSNLIGTDAAGIGGRVFLSIQVAGIVVPLNFGSGLFLYGDDDQDAAAIVVERRTANSLLIANFLVTEFAIA